MQKVMSPTPRRHIDILKALGYNTFSIFCPDLFQAGFASIFPNIDNDHAAEIAQPRRSANALVGVPTPDIFLE